MSYLPKTFHGESLKGIRYLNGNLHLICIIYAKMGNSVKLTIFTQIGSTMAKTQGRVVWK